MLDIHLNNTTPLTLKYTKTKINTTKLRVIVIMRQALCRFGEKTHQRIMFKKHIITIINNSTNILCFRLME